MAQAINPFDRQCDRCGGTIHRDERMEYRMNPGRGVWHPACPSAQSAKTAPAPAPRRVFTNSYEGPGLDGRYLDRRDY